MPISSNQHIQMECSGPCWFCVKSMEFSLQRSFAWFRSLSITDETNRISITESTRISPTISLLNLLTESPSLYGSIQFSHTHATRRGPKTISVVSVNERHQASRDTRAQSKLISSNPLTHTLQNPHSPQLPGWEQVENDARTTPEKKNDENN